MSLETKFTNSHVENIPITALVLGRFTPRNGVDEASVDSIAEDMKKNGQLRVILVRECPDHPGLYEVIDGDHRVMAAKKLGFLTVRAEVIEVDDIDANLLAVLMNESQGRRPTPIEEGLWIKRMMTDYGWSQGQAASRLSRTQQWASLRLKLIENVGEDLMQSLTTRVVDVSKAREIVKLDPGLQGPVVKKVADDRLTFLETQSLVHRIKGHPESLATTLRLEKNELASLPEELTPYTEKHTEPKFEACTCPGCGKRIIVNWALHRMNWEVVPSEG